MSYLLTDNVSVSYLVVSISFFACKRLYLYWFVRARIPESISASLLAAHVDTSMHNIRMLLCAFYND